MKFAATARHETVRELDLKGNFGRVVCIPICKRVVCLIDGLVP